MRRTICAFLILLAGVDRALADPPERVARISFIGGAVSFRSSAATDWSPISLNYPVTIGDHVWTDRTGRLELEMGATAIDLDRSTALSVLNLDHQIVQLRLLQGSAVVRVRDLGSDESIEVDTPNAATTMLRPGVYRVDVGANGDATTVTVRRGDAEVTTDTSAVPVHPGERVAIRDRGAIDPIAAAAVPLDEFEDWVVFRDRRAEAVASVRYVPRGVVGYEDLDEFGAWRVVADYGPVWVPHVQAGWAPYRFGHWAWVDPWGWTWIDDAPWGFAPFHYGRWAFVANGWVWVPGTIVARPVYAPALVAFVGGSNWHVSVGVGEPIGWFPLGPREMFVPAYSVSPVYVAAVNRPHASVTNINVNVTNITYVNRTAPGALTVVSRETFTHARPIAAAAVAVSAPAASAAVVVGHAAPRAMVAAAPSQPSAAPAPPSAIVNRAVVVRTAPPAGAAVAVRPAAPAPAPALRPQAAPAPAPPPDTRVAPDLAHPELAARHAEERAAVEARHAQERAELQARQEAELHRAATAQAQAEAQARHAREQAALDARQKREHEQVEKRQESERRRR